MSYTKKMKINGNSFAKAKHVCVPTQSSGGWNNEPERHSVLLLVCLRTMAFPPVLRMYMPVCYKYNNKTQGSKKKKKQKTKREKTKLMAFHLSVTNLLQNCFRCAKSGLSMILLPSRKNTLLNTSDSLSISFFFVTYSR